MRSLRLLLTVVAVLVAACGGDDAPVAAGDDADGPAAAALAEEDVSVEVTDAGEPRALVHGTQLFLRFDGATLSAWSVRTEGS